MNTLPKWCVEHENVEGNHHASNECSLVESEMASLEERRAFLATARSALAGRDMVVIDLSESDEV